MVEPIRVESQFRSFIRGLFPNPTKKQTSNPNRKLLLGLLYKDIIFNQ